MWHRDGSLVRSTILLLGITFKENCPDLRNTKVPDIYNVLKEFCPNIDVYDPWANPDDVKRFFGIDLITEADGLSDKGYDTIVLCVNHREFEALDIARLKKEKSVVFGVKRCLDKRMVDDRL